MQYGWLVLILISSLTLAYPSRSQMLQPNNPGPGNQAANVSPTGSQVAPEAPVIMIHGLCDGANSTSATPFKTEGTTQPETATSRTSGESAAAGSSPDAKASTECTTVVTRAQFEKLALAVNPNITPQGKLRLAKNYPEVLLFAQKARELGLDTPSFQENAKFRYLQGLQKALIDRMVREAGEVSDAEVEKYYKEHPAAFEQVDLLRIHIPGRKVHPDAQGSATPPDVDVAAERAAMKAEAEKIRKEAAAGGDFEKLERRAYKAANDPDPDSGPEVQVGKVTRDDLPEQYRNAVFGLQVGQVSELVPGVDGWHVFKVRSKTIIPLTEAKPKVQKLRMREAMETLKASINSQFNVDYFGQPSAEEPKLGSEGK